jgi:tetratricopeptide (TPR) repeat protein
VNLGDAYLRLERWSDAEAAFTQGIALEPAAPHRAYFGRAIAREEAGDLEGAYADYSKAAELAPEWDLPRRELARFTVTTQGADGGV